MYKNSDFSRLSGISIKIVKIIKIFNTNKLHFSKQNRLIFLLQAQDCSVFAWGINTMGQCGLGHSHSPIVTPQKISLLDGVPVHQISAGTSHSMAWTTLPSDRRTSVWHKPFCVDLSQETFANVAKMLNTFGLQNSGNIFLTVLLTFKTLDVEMNRAITIFEVKKFY